ncbi:hypothetical protein AMAG_11538 [Allomyces macrogynus ATCC 38327]|uniref:Uncharacterized protein n=1 Tax=Allomyces macrogynus (strain ATCC 38327) TaxID=578462 RepID=A0A0L0SVA0_ALLM3|nr:hypothetical protein AMAG_11538 [Allomyces macrogynus ATCC 38327]|eukprot:KNE66396.1 hypothetical protein AMAG_11538 [Allomyces macrogynus ATCC 38327]
MTALGHAVTSVLSHFLSPMLQSSPPPSSSPALPLPPPSGLQGTAPAGSNDGSPASHQHRASASPGLVLTLDEADELADYDQHRDHADAGDTTITNGGALMPPDTTTTNVLPPPLPPPPSAPAPVPPTSDTDGDLDLADLLQRAPHARIDASELHTAIVAQHAAGQQELEALMLDLFEQMQDACDALMHHHDLTHRMQLVAVAQGARELKGIEAETDRTRDALVQFLASIQGAVAHLQGLTAGISDGGKGAS